MFKDDSTICVFGMRGVGKSYLCRKIQDYFNNVFIFDTLKEYNEQNTFNNYPDFAQFVEKTYDKEGVRAAYQFEIEETKSSEIFDECIRLLYYRKNCLVVIEEVQNFATVHKIPEFLKQCSLTGRHQDMGFLTTTQRVAEIHKSLLSQASDIFVGLTDNPTDLKTVQSYGFDPEMVVNLEPRTFLWKQGRNFYLIDNDLNFL